MQSSFKLTYYNHDWKQNKQTKHQTTGKVSGTSACLDRNRGASSHCSEMLDESVTRSPFIIIPLWTDICSPQRRSICFVLMVPLGQNTLNHLRVPSISANYPSLPKRDGGKYYCVDWLWLESEKNNNRFANVYRSDCIIALLPHCILVLFVCLHLLSFVIYLDWRLKTGL